jgi:predicted  nucleic acid-binding Zn-ribbon protein
MRRHLRRLTLAFCLSLLGLILTRHFFGGDGGLYRRGGQEPIAKLEQTLNEVQRKPLGKLVWETVTQGEDLFPGEDIRTSSASSAKIFLVQSKTMIELDPDSLIRLEQNPDGLALNFLEGNMLVKGEGTGLTLKTGDNAIDVANADLALSKTSGGAVDLEVLKGQAKLMKDGKQVTLDENTAGLLTSDGVQADESRIRVTSPLAGEQVLIDSSKREPIVFEWDKLPDGYDVFVERGTTRTSLNRSEATRANGDAGRLGFVSKLGKYYFRLVAVPRQEGLPTLSSKVMPLEVVPKTPPQPLAPVSDEVVILEKQSPTLALKWAARMRFETVIVEIAKDAGLTQVLKKETVPAESTQIGIAWSESGKFYWRVTGFIRYQGKSVPLSSPVVSFSTKVGIELTPPNLKSPLADQKISYQQVTGQGLFLSWENVPGISKYKVTITKNGKSLYDRDVTANPLRITKIGPGNYEWTVRSVLNENEISVPAEKRAFQIEELPKVEWLDGDGLAENFYLTEKPSIDAAWNRSEGVSSWRVRVGPAGEAKTADQWQSVDSPRASVQVQADGLYEAEVEALNAQGDVVARSALKQFSLKPKPLLPAPEFAADLPEILKADRKGMTQVSWSEVKGAVKYKVLVRTSDGKEVLTTTNADRTIASLQKLKPGRYKISLSSVDEHQRAGPEGQPRTIEVPDTSDIRAPKIKQFKVK